MSENKEDTPKLDVEGQAIDTPLPDGRKTNKDAWAALVEEYEGDPDEVDGQAEEEEKSDG